MTIFTPDHTHFEIAMSAVSNGLHVLVTKPAVMTLAQHTALCNLAQEKNVLVAVEVHKRWDPMYADARDKIIAQLGSLSYMYAYMSQPKSQLKTFQSWIGKKDEKTGGTTTDISYYLNSHHIDFSEWCVGDNGRPVTVSAMASKGVATSLDELKDSECEDTITLMVSWEHLEWNDGNVQVSPVVGTAVYTSSWIAPKSDVHSQQRFFYMGQVRFAYFHIYIFCLS